MITERDGESGGRHNASGGGQLAVGEEGQRVAHAVEVGGVGVHEAGRLGGGREKGDPGVEKWGMGDVGGKVEFGGEDVGAVVNVVSSEEEGTEGDGGVLRDGGGKRINDAERHVVAEYFLLVDVSHDSVLIADGNFKRRKGRVSLEGNTIVVRS